MSFSFNLRAATVSGLLAALPSSFAEVVASQPIHEKDCAFGLPVVMSYVSLITMPPGKEISVAVNGWVQTDEHGIKAVSFAVTATQVEPLPASDNSEPN